MSNRRINETVGLRYDDIDKVGPIVTDIKAMLRAHNQPHQYARALPADEGRPPFILVADVGRNIELYAEFSRSGATYTPYPDPRSHRIRLADLHKDEVRARLRAVRAAVERDVRPPIGQERDGRRHALGDLQVQGEHRERTEHAHADDEVDQRTHPEGAVGEQVQRQERLVLRVALGEQEQHDPDDARRVQRQRAGRAPAPLAALLGDDQHGSKWRDQANDVDQHLRQAHESDPGCS